MNLTLLQILIAVAILGLLFACLLPTFLKHDSRKDRLVRARARRNRVRPLSLFERCLLPFVVAMEALSLWLHRNFTWHGGNRLALGNAALTMPDASDTALADEAIGRYKLIKAGTDVYHKALCDKNNIPEGFTRESSASASEARFSFDYLGLARRASIGTASGAVTAGNLVCPGDDGTLRDITQVSGETVYVCGKALSTAATTAEFVWIPYPPTKLVIA